jgi:hypothetical protein
LAAALCEPNGYSWKTSVITTQKARLRRFARKFSRYHSLAIERASCPRSMPQGPQPVEDGEIQGREARRWTLKVQFRRKKHSDQPRDVANFLAPRP